MLTKEYTKLLLLIILLSSVFMKQVKISKNTFNTFVVISIVLFIFAAVNDLMFSLLFVSIAYVIFSKISVQEKFSEKVKEEVKSKPISKKEETKKETKKETKSKLNTNDEESYLPGHCSKMKNLDEEFLKEYDVSSKKLDDVQNNVFDKYNYDVFYNELGENSLDIQGVFNHEVNGYEKALF